MGGGTQSLLGFSPAEPAVASLSWGGEKEDAAADRAPPPIPTGVADHTRGVSELLDAYAPINSDTPSAVLAGILLAVATVRLDIEYDGAGFKGWAAQPGLRTVQGELEAGLATVLREPVQLTVAGRTDTGVHALGQVASFVTAAEIKEDLARRLNGVGPDDIAVTAAAVAEDGFDARHSAKSRSYRYRVLARSAPSPFEQGRALWWPHRIDLKALEACAAALQGNHDFTAFTPTQSDHVRFDRDILAASWALDKEILTFRITADAFMRNMVRILVGTMLEASGGRRTPKCFHKLLEGAPRTEAGDTAPPHGLYLESVSY
jgi:tRNA pseudouridine38-40 synthase